MNKMLVSALIMGVMVGRSVLAMQPSAIAVSNPLAGLTLGDQSQPQIDILTRQLNQILQIQSLQAQIALHKEMQDGFAKKDIKEKNFKAQFVKSLKSGAVDGIKLVGTASNGTVYFLVKAGVATFILGFTGMCFWQALLSAHYNPLDIAGKASWFLLKFGADRAKHLFGAA